jgi:hypothetical protein
MFGSQLFRLRVLSAIDFSQILPHTRIMSNPFRGSDVAVDNISSEDLEAFDVFMKEKMGKLQETFAEMDAIAATGDEALWEERFGYMSKPHALPDGDTLLTTGVGSPYSFCQLCSKIFAEDIQNSNSWIPAISDRYPHHDCLENLHSAASSGCPNNFSFTSGQSFDKQSPSKIPFQYLTYSISKEKDNPLQTYLLNFVYAGNDAGNDYDKVRKLQLCIVPKSGK